MKQSETCTCVVCKQPIQKELAIQTQSGPVHPGPCECHLKEMALSESESSETLEETGLIL